MVDKKELRPVIVRVEDNFLPKGSFKGAMETTKDFRNKWGIN